MAQLINMDHSKDANSNSPQLEFTLPIDEIKESLQVGDRGSVTIPVEVIQVDSGIISFRKSGKSSSNGAFHTETASEMRENLPVADK